MGQPRSRPSIFRGAVLCAGASPAFRKASTLIASAMEPVSSEGNTLSLREN